MGNGWKSAAVCGLAIVGLFAFASDADAFWGRHRCGHQRHSCCQVAYAPAVSSCCNAAPAPCCDAAPAPCCDAAPAPCCDAAPAPCCDSTPVHHVGYASQGCCGGGHYGHHRHHRHYGGGCCGSSHYGGYGGGYQSSPVYAQPAGGCTNCQAPW